MLHVLKSMFLLVQIVLRDGAYLSQELILHIHAVIGTQVLLYKRAACDKRFFWERCPDELEVYRMVQQATKLRVHADWANRLGCTFADMLSPNLIVRPHSESFEGYNGIYCFYNGTTCVISAPAKYVLRIDKAVTNLRPEEAFDADLLVHSIEVGHQKVIGPAFQGYVDFDSFLQTSSSSVVELETERHRILLEELRESCSEIEWQHSSIDEQWKPILLRIFNERVVAAGSWRAEKSGFLSIGIISHPAHRGKGHAKAVVSALTERGLASGATMHYQTLESNTSSVAIAQSLGYERLGRTLAIRLG